MPSESWEEYRRTYSVYKAEREAAGSEWDRFKNSVDSQDKLDVLQEYIAAVNRYVLYYFHSNPQCTEIIVYPSCGELTYRTNYWNDAWGDQDAGHTQWLERLRTMSSELEYQEAILSHRIDTERYETIDDCVPSTSGLGNRTGGHGELRDATENICGDPDCGKTFICAADYNRVVEPQGYPGV